MANNYAFSKYAGELAAALIPSTILRTNFIGLSHAPNRESLTDWVFDSIKNGESIKVLSDVFFSPLSMVNLSEMINLVIEKKPIGIFNLGSRNGMSKADFDFSFAECLGLQTKTMTRITTEQATFLEAYRPKDMRLDSSKFEKALGVILPSLSDEIQLVANDYLE
ncbi:sugar nucleotide-binding protein [Candidatus Woesearchaeota archaeon]|nr:sugar nucleotide-binding protein [Candidatus Woesearchaeota archaeon]